MATKTARQPGTQIPMQAGATCRICPKPAKGWITFASPTGKMQSIWVCRQCFRDAWAMLTTPDGK